MGDENPDSDTSQSNKSFRTIIIKSIGSIIALAITTAISIVIATLLPRLLPPEPPPPHCIVTSFQITSATDVSTVRNLVTVPPNARLLIKANINGCDYTPHWETITGEYILTSNAGIIVYTVPDTPDEVTVILPDNAGEEQAILTVNIADY